MSAGKQRIQMALKKFQHKPLISIGTLGNSSGVVDVPGKPNYVYVTVPGSGTLIVYNERVAAVPGQPVELGRDPFEPDQYQVINVHKYPQINSATAPVIGGVPASHAPTHNWSGNDPVYIEKRQLMPLRATPTTNMNVFVTREIAFYDNDWCMVSGTNLDMSVYMPITGSLYALIYKDIDESVRVSVSGTLKDTFTLTLHDAPRPYPGTVPIALVRLYTGQSGIYDNPNITDIVDVRPMFDALENVTGSFGGVAVSRSGSTVDNHLAIWNGNDANSLKDGGPLPIGLLNDYICIQDQKTQGTAGGTFNSGAWQTRDLNTEISDDGNHANISVNQITLEAGTYIFKISAPACAVNAHQAKLYNITDASDIGLGSSEFGSSLIAVNIRSFVQGKFIISTSKVFEVRHRCQTSSSGDGFGHQSNLDVEIYTIVELWKIA